MTGDGRRSLSRTQAAILEFIAWSVEARGYPPTMREIGGHVGLSSSSSVAHQLEVLAGRGYIVRDPRSPRAIKVLPPPPLTTVDGQADES